MFFAGYPMSGRGKRHDLVFASARLRLESASSGVGVIVSDCRGESGFLTPENVSSMWRRNFGGETFAQPLKLDGLEQAITSYESDAASQTGAWIRRFASLESGCQRLEKIYIRAVLPVSCSNRDSKQIA